MSIGKSVLKIDLWYVATTLKTGEEIPRDNGANYSLSIQKIRGL
jgi:hypothetical protein